ASDLIAMKSEFEERDLEIRTLHDGWMMAFRALENCEEISMDERQAVNRSLSRFQSANWPNIRSSAYNEMQATGTFSRLEDNGIKKDIASLYAAFGRDSLARLGERNNQLSAGRIIWSHIPFTFESNDPFDNTKITSDMVVFEPLKYCDELALQEKLSLQGAIWEMVDGNRDWLDDSRDFVGQIDSLLERLPAPNPRD
ncbi:MAG: hypothetical protein AAGJ51_14220, partial [Pseudomonadota bacterium]